jgi:hypothetical protein
LIINTLIINRSAQRHGSLQTIPERASRVF